VAVMFMLACTISIPPDLTGGKTTPAPSAGKGTPVPAATKSPDALRGDAEGAIIQSVANLRALKSYRIKLVVVNGLIVGPEGKTVTIKEVVPPNKVHQVTESAEIIIIGDDMYTKTGDTWLKTTQAVLSAQYTKPYVTPESIWGFPRWEGAETVSGVACERYVYQVKVGDNPVRDSTVWIGVKDGLPYQVITKLGPASFTTQTLYDINADIKIEPPPVD